MAKLFDEFDFHEVAEACGEGEYYVYVWEDHYGDIFYVGSGQGRRYRDISGRSLDFRNHLKSCGGRPLIVTYGMSKDEARSFEYRLINAYRKLKFPLTNATTAVFASWHRATRKA